MTTKPTQPADTTQEPSEARVEAGIKALYYALGEMTGASFHKSLLGEIVKSVLTASDAADPSLTDPAALSIAYEAGRAKGLEGWNRFHHVMKKHGLHPGRTDDDLLVILDTHLSAPTPAAAPHGWKLVPVEPTQEMLDATYDGQHASDIYRDMLSASPQPPSAAVPPVDEAMRKDAERYRWLKKQFRAMSLDMGGKHVWVQARSGSIRGPNMDAAVDAAMPPSPEQKEEAS